MGKLLQVRVMAYTVDPDGVALAWPKLSGLAYPAGHGYAPARRGVVELVETLSARLSADELSRELVLRLKPGLAKAAEAVAALSEALASWKADEAQRLTERIENLLDELEEMPGGYD